MTNIRQMTYQPPEGIAANVETMSFARLRELDQEMSERGDFFVVALIESGHGSVAVDYQQYELERRTIVWVGPGVVHRWLDIARVEGDIVLFTPTAPVAPSARALTAAPGTGAVRTVDERQWRLVCRAVAHLRSEFEDALATAAPPSEILGSVLSAFLLRAVPAEQAVGAGHDLFQRFRSAVESDLGRHRDVAHYARALGFSERTLSRAAHSNTGRSAKAYLTERVVLEAKRLLAHEQLPLKEVARRLAFSDTSALTAFFRRETGMPPGAWRDRAVGQIAP
ncbi:AraC family transcriptional regulator [Subtercola sp. YIM 133946]|uniref:AraC family transcriptional regulator n=1 Tax=Subtercola sp. YIM 133946 TaxID=3118909 RepID=UPI002F9467B3